MIKAVLVFVVGIAILFVIGKGCYSSGFSEGKEVGIQEERDAREQSLQQYIYVDVHNTAHMDRKCKVLRVRYSETSERKPDDVGVEVFPIEQLQEFRICPHCVSDGDYERQGMY